MSKILAVYDESPKFPATDQHPDAARYLVDGNIVDATGGQPTPEEVAAFLNPPDPLAPLTSKATDGTITLPELVELLRVKGII